MSTQKKKGCIRAWSPLVGIHTRKWPFRNKHPARMQHSSLESNSKSEVDQTVTGECMQEGIFETSGMLTATLENNARWWRVWEGPNVLCSKEMVLVRLRYLRIEKSVLSWKLQQSVPMVGKAFSLETNHWRHVLWRWRSTVDNLDRTEISTEKAKIVCPNIYISRWGAKRIEERTKQGCKPTPEGGKVNMQWSKHQTWSKILLNVQKIHKLYSSISNFIQKCLPLK